MTAKFVFCLLLGGVLSQQQPKCNPLSWSVPATSYGPCTNTGFYDESYWFCDWETNSAYYKNYFKCHPFTQPLGYSSYESYRNNLPSQVNHMMTDAISLLSKCTGVSSMQVSSWNTIPYVCPSVASSSQWYQSSSYLSSLPDMPCRNIQSHLCEALAGELSSAKTSTQSRSTFTNTQVLNPLAHFMAHYDYNSYRMLNPHVQHARQLATSYFDMFVSSIYDCQRSIWNSMVKIDCSVLTSMFGNLGYPETYGYPYTTQYPTAYQRYLTDDPADLCKTLVDHVYKNFAAAYNKAVEYVSMSSFVESCPAQHQVTDKPLWHGITRGPLLRTIIRTLPATKPYRYHGYPTIPRGFLPRFPTFPPTTVSTLRADERPYRYPTTPRAFFTRFPTFPPTTVSTLRADERPYRYPTTPRAFFPRFPTFPPTTVSTLRADERPYRYPTTPRGFFPRYPTFSTVHTPGADERLETDVLSVWVIIGEVGFLAFCALLFCLIYKLYTHRNKGAAEIAASATYEAGASGDEAAVGVRDYNPLTAALLSQTQ